MAAIIHASDKLQTLVNKLDKGYILRTEAEKQWKVLCADITAEKVKKWDSVQKARAFNYLLQMRFFGFAVADEVLDVAAVRPDPADIQASVWWIKARKYEGSRVINS